MINRREAPATTSASPLSAVLDRVERMEALDRVVGPVEEFVRRVPEEVREGFRGVGWLGTPLHPALVHLPIGACMAASVMDAAGQPEAARSLTVLGVAGAIPAAWAGWSDWVELRDGQKRLGLVHAAANVVGLVLYGGSIAARCSGSHRVGRKLGLLGLITVSAGAAVGGDLVFRRGAGQARGGAR